MKKKSSGFSMDSVKSFFINHGEKVGFGVAVALVGVFFYLGYGTTPLEDPDLDPKKLAETAQNRRSAISNSSWDTFTSHRKVNESPDISDRKVQESFVQSRLGQDPPPRKDPRVDPELKPPTDLIARGQYVSLAITMMDNFENKVDQLPLYEDADLIMRRRREEEQRQEEANNAFGSGFDGGGGGKGGGGGGKGGGGERTDDEEEEAAPALPNKYPGEIPSVMRREIEGVATLPNFSPYTSRLYGLYAVGVTAIVPYDNQWKEYENKLQQSIGYNPNRDYPEYVYLEVQRRKAGGKWEDISEKVAGYQDQYAIFAPEIVDRPYTDPVLTQQLPPILVDSLEAIAMHDKVKRASFGDEPAEDESGEAEVDRENFDPFGRSGGRSGGAPRGGRGMGRGGMQEDGPGAPGGAGGPPGAPGGGGGGKGAMGAGGGKGAMGGGGGKGAMGAGGGMAQGEMGAGPMSAGPEKDDVDVKLVRFFDLEVRPGETYEYQVRVWLSDVNNPDNRRNEGASGRDLAGGGGMAPGGGGKGGMAPGGGGGKGGMGSGDGKGGGGIGAPGGETGGVGMGVDRGNAAAQAGPVRLTSTMLDPAVRNRLRDWENSAEFRGLPVGDPRRTARATDWSEPSAPLTVPGGNVAKVFGGPAEMGTEYEANGVKFFGDEVVGKIAVRMWDQGLFCDVPHGRDVYAADMLNYVVEGVSLLNPLDLTRRLLVEDDKEIPHEFKTNMLVVGITGGEELPSKGNDLRAPAEMLLFDMDGNFKIVNEFDDAEEYRHSLFMDDDQLEDRRGRFRRGR